MSDKEERRAALDAFLDKAEQVVDEYLDTLNNKEEVLQTWAKRKAERTQQADDNT